MSVDSPIDFFIVANAIFGSAWIFYAWVWLWREKLRVVARRRRVLGLQRKLLKHGWRRVG